jgi:hypothetical protein
LQEPLTIQGFTWASKRISWHQQPTTTMIRGRWVLAASRSVSLCMPLSHLPTCGPSLPDLCAGHHTSFGLTCAWSFQP